MKYIKHKITFYLLIFFFVSFAQISFAQIPVLFSPEALDDLPETPAWDLNKAEPCGRFICSKVFFFSDLDFTTERIKIALPRDITKSTREIALEVEQRARFVQNVFRGIFANIQRFIQTNPVQEKKDLSFWLITNQKPLHPTTPIVEVGIENNQTVVFVAGKRELGLTQQAIITVTDVDARANITTIQKLAEIWQIKIKNSFSNALWGLEMDKQRPFLRLKFFCLIIICTALFMIIARKIKKLLRKWKKKLNQELEAIYDTLKVHPEIQSNKKNISNIQEKSPQEIEEFNHHPRFFERMFTKGINNSKQVIYEGLSFSAKLLPTAFHQKQNFIQQKINLIELITSLLFLMQMTLILLAIAMITITFRETRFLFNLFFTQAILLPLIWIVMILSDKITDFWIDHTLNEWAKEKQGLYPDSNRTILRVNTYSPALRGATTVIFNLMGIFLTLGVIGISPNIIAGAGTLAVILAVLSRNLLDDLLNGILILTTDRYAVGDVVEINNLMGLVESMDIYATSLRNLDGQLIIIPHGKVATVINMTKNWSRVNFTIEVSWNSDIQKTMNILQNVADQMYKEPQWQEKIYESADVLGIEEISHKGIVIRVIIKTLPLQQWIVGREYRWRVIQAFDLAGISLGIPQIVVWHKDH